MVVDFLILNLRFEGWFAFNGQIPDDSNGFLVTPSAMAEPKTIDDVFGLIGQGNDYKKDKDWWNASSAYTEVQEALGTLATHEDTPQDIEQLYTKQQSEYLVQARNCFIEALQETGSSKQDDLESDEAAQRMDLFGQLFCGQEAVTLEQASNNIEERLNQLNESLPSGFKTSDERMRDINRGLNRLGLSGVTATAKPTVAMKINTDLSEDDQVAQLMAQAKDQVQFDGAGDDGEEKDGKDLTGDAIDRMISNDEEDDEEDEETAVKALIGRIATKVEQDGETTEQGPLPLPDLGDEDLTSEQANEIQDTVATAQASLAESICILEEPTLVDKDSLYSALQTAQQSLLRALQQIEGKYVAPKKINKVVDEKKEDEVDIPLDGNDEPANPDNDVDEK